MTAKVTVTSVAVATEKFLFGIGDCTVNSYVGTGNFLLVLGILHVCGHSLVRSPVSPSMGCIISLQRLGK